MTLPKIEGVNAGDWVKVATNYDGHRGTWEGECWSYSGANRLQYGMGECLRDEEGRLGWRQPNELLGRQFIELMGHRPAATKEPTGLGAVVKDGDGHLWVHYTTTEKISYSWYRIDGATSGNWGRVSRSQPVKVLSEGMTSW